MEMKLPVNSFVEKPLKTLLLLFISINGIVLAQNGIKLPKILKQLNLVVSKLFPRIENETIVVIPEIAKEEEGLF